MRKVISLMILQMFIAGIRATDGDWDYLKYLNPLTEDDLIYSETFRVVGGSDAKPGEFPFVVGLWRKRESRPFCGGSLISSNWVLTAAHCVFGKSPRSLEMMLGDNDVKKKDSGERRVAACKIVNHPYYSSTRTAHDIALIKLCKQARISPVIDVIGLSGAHTDLSNVSNVTVAGWGKTQEDGRVSRILQYVSLNVIPRLQCALVYPWVHEKHVCAGTRGGGGRDSCQGDSGGPLWFKDTVKQERLLVGIVSSGRGCARPRYPGIYTNVAEYFSWILGTMASK